MDRRSLIVLLALWGLGVSEAGAQERSISVVASFDGATRLAVDPFGNAYVIDRTRGRLVRVDLQSRIEKVVGGSESPVRDPVAVDAGTGLSVLIADGNTGRIGRFNRDLVWSGDLRDRDEIRSRNADARDQVAARTPSIQPNSIATLRTGSVLLLDSRSGVLLILDRRGEVDRLLRIPDLRLDSDEPLDLCVDSGDRIHVLMSRPASVVTLDAMGNVLGEHGISGEVSGTIACISEEVFVPTAEGLVALRAGTTEPWPGGIDGRVLAVQRSGEESLYLTEKALFTTGPTGARRR